MGHSSLGGGVANSRFDSLEEAVLAVVDVGGMMMLVSVRVWILEESSFCRD